MPLVMNALDDENVVTVGGNTFTFKPRQIKEIYNPDIHHVITRIKSEDGFVGLPEELTYIVHLKPEQLDKMVSDEHKTIIQDAIRTGVENHVKHLRGLVYNAQVSLGRDMAQKNFKHDPRSEYSAGDLKNLEKLIKYQSSKNDVDQKRVDKIKELEKQAANK